MSCQPNRFITMKTKDSAELLIYDTIGESWFGDSITAKQFRQELKDAGDVSTLNIRINSPGGMVTHGIAIYEALREHAARKVVYIDGIAASMASIIAMVGDEVNIADGGFVMIHDPYMFAEGNAEDLRRYADMMEKSKEKMVAIYSGKSKLSDSEVSALMTAETWMTSDEAVAKGFADKISGKAVAVAGGDVNKFKNIPQAAKALLLEARKREEREEPTDMADQTKNEPVPATLAELKAACEGADAVFLVEQIEAKATVTDALKAYAVKLKADADAAKAEAAKAKATKPEPEAKGKQGVEPLAEGKADNKGADPMDRAEELVVQRMELRKEPRNKAWVAVMRANPELRAQLVESANAGR